MQTPALIALTLAVSASALAHAGPAVTPAPLMARDDAACARGAAKISADLPPVPTGDLASWMAEHDGYQILQSALDNYQDGETIADVNKACEIMTSTPTPPASLASAWSSYSEQEKSWLSRASPLISSVAAECTGTGAIGAGGAGFELILATDVPQCTNALNRYNRAVSSDGPATPRYVAAAAGIAGLAAAVVLF
ncbi:hypothetical protein C8A01DRAFT_41345 [Parachaetomium inaequale]|uniref:DUF7735 domain-containing protein n=1 Tax=Parachaetomium inaequale TaxID=2588326 RepID=A0AAN6P5T1_9PEZI|nr:hypothetical protein C8A01DRAFT_41345 [Parachaetomium inaequale]